MERAGTCGKTSPWVSDACARRPNSTIAPRSPFQPSPGSTVTFSLPLPSLSHASDNSQHHHIDAMLLCKNPCPLRHPRPYLQHQTCVVCVRSYLHILHQPHTSH